MYNAEDGDWWVMGLVMGGGVCVCVLDSGGWCIGWCSVWCSGRCNMVVFPSMVWCSGFVVKGVVVVVDFVLGGT